MCVKSVSVLAIVGCVSLCSGAITTSFEGGVPAGWSASSQWRTASYGGVQYLCSNIATATAGTEGLVKSTTNVSAEDLPNCNNVVAEVVLSNKEPMNENVDMFQVVISTNASWSAQDIIPIGNPFKYYKSSSAGDWASHKVFATVDGLSDCKEFYLGLKVIAAGWGMNSIYVKSISVDFLAGAACTGICFNDSPKICDENVVVTATINKEPDEAISDLTVWAIISRNGFVYTNQMFEAVDGSYTNDVLKVDQFNVGGIGDVPPIDAGDVLEIGIFTKYASSLPAMGDFDELTSRYIEKSDSSIKFTAPQLGSVWINEFSLDTVELCGTTNRTYVAGWSLELIDANFNVAARKEFANAFDFSNMPNKMIGLETHTLGWQIGEPNNPYSLRLINAAGVVEHQEDGLTITGSGDVFGMTGVANWPVEGYAYDWSGTATNGTFSWGSSDNSSFGQVNEGQYFEVENMGWFQVKTVVPMGEAAVEPLGFASVDYVINWSSAQTNGVEQTDANGQTPIVAFSGSHTNYESVVAEFGVSAFGWLAETTKYSLLFGMTNDNVLIELSPTVAMDDFSAGRLNSYWGNIGTKNFYYAQLGGNGFARFESRMATHGTDYAAIKSMNYLKSRGNACLAMSFSVRNDISYGLDGTIDYAYIQIATNDNFLSEHVIGQSVSMSNRIAGVATGSWNSGITIVKLPSFIDEFTPMYPRIVGVAGGWSMLYLDVDDVCIAFQNMATVTNVVRTGTETNPGFEIDVEPWCGEGQCVSNVSVQLVMDVNGTVFTNYACANGEITNNLSAATAFTVSPEVVSDNLMAALGQAQLRAHDAVKYWAQVTYYADSRDPDPAKEWETRYYPDNATVDGEGRWVVEGAYGLDMDKVASTCSYDVSGGPITINGDFLLDSNDVSIVNFGFRAYDAAGVSNVTATISAAGMDDQSFNFTTNGVVRYDNEVAATGLAANTQYTVTINATDVSGNPITPGVFTFCTLPEAPTVTIEGISAGEVRLTASGDAAGFKVLTSGWAQASANTWTRNGTPNQMFEATVCATNVNGAESAPAYAAGYTLAAVATMAPTIEKGTASVSVGADADYHAGDDGNPDGTEYAVLVTTSSGRSTLVSTGSVDAIWQTLADWLTPVDNVAEPAIDFAATNYFSFVTRNDVGVVTTNVNPVVTNCWFDITAGFNGIETGQTADGTVEVSLSFADPANSDDAAAEVEYRVDRGDWTPLSGFAVHFVNRSAATNFQWDAWDAVGEIQGEYLYDLRVKVGSESSGRSSDWAEFSGALDFAPPTRPVISGTPGNDAETNVKHYNLSAASDDSSAITYHWILNGVASTGQSLEGDAVADGIHAAGVYAVDAYGNVSLTNYWTWTYDAKPPTEPDFTTKPRACTSAKSYSFVVDSTDALSGIASYFWSLDDGAFAAGPATFAGEAGEEREYTVKVYATDNAGNVSTTNTWSWKYDATSPTEPEFTAKPDAFMHVKQYSFTASSTDPLSGVDHYYWSLNDGEFVAGPATTNGEVAAEGAYTMKVYAADKAGNVSTTNSWSWTYDATPPTKPAFSAKPDAFTNEKQYSLTVSSEESVSGVAGYFWSLNGGAFAAGTETYAGEAGADGEYTVRVYAVDGAGNVSLTNTCSWTYDATSPSEPEFSAKPDKFTNEKAYSLTASSSDALSGVDHYYWSLNDGAFAEGTATYAGEAAAEGAYTVKVYAADKAGNVSDTNTWSWTYDATSPSAPAFTAKPDEFVNDTGYTITVESTDDRTGLAGYFWSFDDGEFVAGPATTNGEVAAEGVYTVRVYATDKAGNASPTNTCSWTYDLTPPSMPELTAKPDAITNVKQYSLTASSEESVSGVAGYFWSLNGGAFAAGDATFAGEATAEGDYAVRVYAVDGAGNVSPTNTWSWTYDATPPSSPTFTAKPDEFVNDTGYTITVESTDDRTGLAGYFWSFDDGEFVAGPATTNGEVAAEGVYTVRVYATDKAGNASPTNSCSWTYDLTPPSMPEFTAKPAAFTHEKNYSFVASSEDAVSGVSGYYWSLNGGAFAAGDATFGGETAAEGEYVVKVYATDGAGNVSATNTWSWTYDKTSPTVVLSSDTPDYFNLASSPMKVTVEFSEFVTNFTAQSVEVENKKEVVVAPLGVATNRYTVTITPNGDGEVSVKVPAGVVADYAGNGNEASAELARIYDATSPTVELTSSAPQKLCLADVPFEVTVTFDEPVTNFTAGSVTVSNGTVQAVAVSTDPATTNKLFVLTINTSGVEVTAISVSIAAAAVNDLAGNPNEASNVLSRDCDVKRPVVAVMKKKNGQDAVQLKKSKFIVTVSISEPVTGVETNWVTVVNGSARVRERPVELEYSVEITPDAGAGSTTFQVDAGAVTDLAGNSNDAMEGKYVFSKDGSGNWSYVKE